MFATWWDRGTDADDLAETLSLAEVQIVPYRDLLVVRASIVQHQLITAVLDTMREQLSAETN